MDIHIAIVNHHNGIMDIYYCCELWISMIIIDIHNGVIDQNSIMNICICIIDIFEDRMVSIYTYGHP